MEDMIAATMPADIRLEKELDMEEPYGNYFNLCGMLACVKCC